MIRLQDIQSLTEFQRNTREQIERLKKTGRPAVLTVNGEAQIVVQDAKSYQKLLARVEEADKLMELRRSVAEFRAGRFRPVTDVLDELETRYVGKTKLRNRRRPK
jgi:prevent-host-death family protein